MTTFNFSSAIINWFQKHGRHHLPWQHNPTPYRVWISEIMLQQTQVTTVIPYYKTFMQNFPTLKSLAAAELNQALRLWTGLGYYSRARNCHKTAQLIVSQHHGRFPRTIEQLTSLPGIGRSTAGAIASLAMNQPQAILDGNVKRILTRFFEVEGWPGTTQTLKRLWSLSETVTPLKNTHHFNQAMMDIGSMICKRRQPLCKECPINTHCLAHKNNTQHDYPTPKPKKNKRLVKTAHQLIMITPQQEILLEQRPEKGIWGGLWSFPETENNLNLHLILKQYSEKNIGASDKLTAFTHKFTHFDLVIQPWVMNIDKKSTLSLDKKNIIWYKLKQELPGGVPAPTKKLLLSLTEDYT